MCSYSLTGRNDERKVKAASGENHHHAETVGYVPREHLDEHMLASGCSCACMGSTHSTLDQVNVPYSSIDSKQTWVVVL